MIRIDSCASDDCRQLPLRADAVAICGNILDDRGAEAVNTLKDLCGQVVTIDSYDPLGFAITVDDRTVEADLLPELPIFDARQEFILEASTLGFVELFLVCRALAYARVPAVDVLYVEPDTYNRVERSRGLLDRREFELSGEVAGYRAIPGATIMLSDREAHHGVFFLGFEERRLDVAFEDFEMLRPSECDVVFGVPAFQAGWEMDAFANNVRVLVERKISGEVMYCGANSVGGALRLLMAVHDSLSADTRMFVAPLGTKPHGIATAVFAAVHENVGLLYDHPVRRRGRSAGVGVSHLYRVTLVAQN